MTDKPHSPDHARIRALLEQYGADLTRFPEAERETAAALIANDAELQACQREAADLDALLSLPSAAKPSADLNRRIAEIPLRHPQQAPAPGWLNLLLGGRLSLRFSAAFVVAASLGVVSGLAVAENTEIVAETGTGTETATEDSWDALETVAFADGLLFEDLDAEANLEGTIP